MSAYSTILVVSAGGTLGGAIVSALLAGGNYEVTGLTSKHSTAVLPKGVKHMTTDYSIESLSQAFAGQDVIVSAISGAGIAAQKVMVDVAIQCQVKWFIPSEYGVDTSSPRAAVEIPFLATKVEVVDMLKARQDKITWTAVCIGNLFDWGLNIPGFGGFDVPAKTAVLYDGGKSEFEATTIAQVASTIIKVLEQPLASKNQYVYVNSFTTTQRKILAALETATKSKFAITHDTIAELRRTAFERMERGEKKGVLDAIAAAIYGVPELGRFSQHKELWNAKIGVTGQDLDQEIGKAIHIKDR